METDEIGNIEERTAKVLQDESTPDGGLKFKSVKVLVNLFQFSQIAECRMPRHNGAGEVHTNLNAII